MNFYQWALLSTCVVARVLYQLGERSEFSWSFGKWSACLRKAMDVEGACLTKRYIFHCGSRCACYSNSSNQLHCLNCGVDGSNTEVCGTID